MGDVIKPEIPVEKDLKKTRKYWTETKEKMKEF